MARPATRQQRLDGELSREREHYRVAIEKLRAELRAIVDDRARGVSVPVDADQRLYSAIRDLESSHLARMREIENNHSEATRRMRARNQRISFLSVLDDDQPPAEWTWFGPWLNHALPPDWRAEVDYRPLITYESKVLPIRMVENRFENVRLTLFASDGSELESTSIAQGCGVDRAKDWALQGIEAAWKRMAASAA